MTVIGTHVFAGAFTRGVQRVFPVKLQLETHGFGINTASQFVEVINDPGGWERWPRFNGVTLVYGNPRCTAFSSLTSGYGPNVHGPLAKACRDIHDLCKYGITVNADVIVWESVQQAFTRGRSLLDQLRDKMFLPAGYRVAHFLLSAATFGNSQNRKRYFFVAYKRGRNFCSDLPEPPKYRSLGHDLQPHFFRSTKPAKTVGKTAEYDGDCYEQLTPDEWDVLPILCEGESLNTLGRDRIDDLRKVNRKLARIWNNRVSNMPFSLHCLCRARWNQPAPTLYGSCNRIVHPRLDRPITVREAAGIMGWDFLPRGPQPFPQIAKGVCPSVGEWLAQQVKHYLENRWGAEDWSAEYITQSDGTGYWRVQDVNDAPEKIFHMTRCI